MQSYLKANHLNIVKQSMPAMLFDIYMDDEVKQTATVGTQTETTKAQNRKREDGTYDKSILDPNYFRKYWSFKRCNEECKICGTTVDKTSMNRHHKTFKCQLRDINNKKKQTEAEGTFNIM